MQPDREKWINAGGDAERLDLYQSVGRVAPLSDGDDRALASIHPDRPHTGAIGDWVGGPAMLQAAEDWLRAQGCTEVVGPMEMCRWFNYRANLGPFDEAPFSFEPTHLAGRWLESDYRVITRYASVLADHDSQIRAGLDRAAGLSARGWTIQPLSDRGGTAPAGTFAGHLPLVHELFSAGFADNDGFARIPAEAIYRFYAPYRDAIDLRLTLMAYDPDGRPAAFLLALPETLQPARKWFLILSLTIVPRYRANGIGTWLVAAAHQAARKAGYSAGVHCFVHTPEGHDNRGFSGKIIRRYALLQKEL